MYWRLAARITMGALFLVPGLTWSLGLGEIQVHSALNQPMDAEIEILDFDASELDEIDVELGSQAIFERVGVPRPFLLTRLRFTPAVSQGKPVIRVTSTDPIPEPFLTFLIDLRWSQGQLLREYTVLLDPPVFGNQIPGGSVQQPVLTQTAPEQVQQQAPPPKQVSKPKPTLRNSSPKATQPRNQVARPTPPSTSVDGDTVRVERGDTLWNISEQFINGSDLSINQMMLAIQDVNPNAFADDNINNLKTGTILRVPSQQDARVRSKSEALSEVRSQWQVWQKGQQLSDSTAVNVDSATPTDDSVEIKQDAQSESSKAKLSILGDTQTAGGLSGSDAEAVEELRGQIALLKESVASKEQVNEELLSRIAALDEILKKQENIIKLQNDQLAQLQNNAELANDQAADSSTELQQEVAELNQAAEAELEKSKTLLEEAQLDETTEIAQADSEAAISQPRLEPLPDFSGPIPEEFLQAEAELEAETQVEQTTETPAEPEVVVAETPVAEEVSLKDKVLAAINQHRQNLLYAGGAIIAILLGLVGLRRRREKAESEALASRGMPVFVDEKLDDVVEETDIATSDSVDQTLDELDEVDEASSQAFIEKSPADNDEVLEEAEVYISYGLYQQADDLLQQAVKNNPDNVAYQAKLAEVYHGEKRTDEFVEFVQSNEQSLKSEPAVWSKIATMGLALAPANSLFSDSPATDNVVEMDDVAASTTDDIIEEPAVEDATASNNDEGLDFSFDDPTLSDQPTLSMDANDGLSQDDVDELLPSEQQQNDQFAQPLALDTGAEDLIAANNEEDGAADESAADPMEDTIIEDNASAIVDDVAEESLDENLSDEATLQFDTTSLEDDLVTPTETGRTVSEDELDDLSSDLALNTEELDVEDLKLDVDLGESAENQEETMMFDSSILSKDELNLDENAIEEHDSEMETALFDSSLFEMDELNEAASEVAEANKLEEDTETIEQLQENLTAELETLSFDVDGDKAALETEEIDQSDLDISDDITQSLDVSDLDTEFADLDGLMDDEDDLDPPTVVEEVGTKLDLAKAFVDMGDEDAAKETLTEVMQRGDDTQIREAKDLLDKIT